MIQEINLKKISGMLEIFLVQDFPIMNQDIS